MKSVFSVAVPALLLMSTSAFAADPTTMQPSGGKADQQMSAGTGGLQGSQTGAANMNGPNGDGSAGNGGMLGSGPSNTSMAANSGVSNDSSINPSVSATAQLSASADTSPTYQGGRRAYRNKSEASLNRSEAQITAQLNQEQSQFAGQ
jgi:hypothetical protein